MKLSIEFFVLIQAALCCWRLYGLITTAGLLFAAYLEKHGPAKFYNKVILTFGCTVLPLVEAQLYTFIFIEAKMQTAHTICGFSSLKQIKPAQRVDVNVETNANSVNEILLSQCQRGIHSTLLKPCFVLSHQVITGS